MTEPTSPAARPRPTPVAPGERIVSLDVLRGVAILGILIMNIQAFSMIDAAYLNPTAYGDLTGVNRLVWVLSHLVADTKFLSVFSMLFGAGIVLSASRLREKGVRPGPVHYRRTLWLLLVGLAHGYFLWYGDILAMYAIVALVVYLFWSIRPLPLAIIGLAVLCVSPLLYWVSGVGLSYAPPEALEGMMAFWRPGADAVAGQLAAYRGTWGAQMTQRVPSMSTALTMSFAAFLAWRSAAMMLLGMALYKWGVLSAERSRKFYLAMAVIGLAVGFPTVWLGVVRRFADGWTLQYSFLRGALYNYWGSALVALGYVGLVMLAVRGRELGRLGRTLAAAGRMAFTNYLLQTAICTTLFYGHGFGLFGRIERWGQILIVFGVWAFQLWFSRFWLERYRFGPVEWLWRTLTYMRPQPMRR